MTEVTETAAAVPIRVKWGGKDFEALMMPNETVGDLKLRLQELTDVAPSRQKLLGLKEGTKPATDGSRVGNLTLKPGSKVMMMGTAEAGHRSAAAPNAAAGGAGAGAAAGPPSSGGRDEAAATLPEVLDDLDDPEPLDGGGPEAVDLLAVLDEELVRERLERRVERANIKVLAGPRGGGKHLLVLDIDYTLFDLGSSAERPEELARPYLHHFLEEAYAHYDLAIWSATGMRWVEVKMRELGVTTSDRFKVAFLMDNSAMVTVRTRSRVYDCKPLEVIWRRFPESYSPANTIMIDDLQRNFVLNPRNGLTIRPYRHAHRKAQSDRELLYLTAYLRHAAGRARAPGDDAGRPSDGGIADLDHASWADTVALEIAELRQAAKRARRAAEEEVGGGDGAPGRGTGELGGGGPAGGGA